MRSIKSNKNTRYLEDDKYLVRKISGWKKEKEDNIVKQTMEKTANITLAFLKKNKDLLEEEDWFMGITDEIEENLENVKKGADETCLPIREGIVRVLRESV
jgi:hypothetical protein